MVGSIDRHARPDQPDPPDRPDRSDRSERSDRPDRPDRPERSERPETPQDFDAKLTERLSTLTRASAYERLHARAEAQDAPFRERLAREESARPKDSLAADKPERDPERPRTYWTEVPRFLATWHDHAQKWLRAEDRKGEEPITPGSRSEAADSVIDVYSAEPEISDAVRVVEVNNARRGWLEGFEFRLKSESRLLEKVAASLETSSPDSTAREIMRQIPDAVRYTFCFRSGDYAAGYYDIKQRLETCGYQIYYSKNSWSIPSTKESGEFLSWSELLCGEGVVVAVAGVMDAFVFLPQVESADSGSKSPLVMRARSLRIASAASSPHRAPVMSMRSLTRWRQAPSITPVAMGQPLARAVG